MQIWRPHSLLIDIRFPVAHARARYGVGKLPLFGEPRAWRWFRKQDHAAIEKSLFDPFIVGPTDRLSVFLAFPKPNGTSRKWIREKPSEVRHLPHPTGRKGCELS
jgi:hypothetical protein